MGERCFAESYTGARGLFLAACGRAGAGVTSHRHPGAGPEGEALYLDVAIVGDPAAQTRLVISSGLHGVEGYCGSACQVVWLRSGEPAALPAHLCVILVHALNPYGFAWIRRFNEDNVDLNRNFLGDFSQAPANPRYASVADAVKADPTDAKAWRAAEKILADYHAREGEAAYTEAVSGGQYVDPAGIFYGGASPCWTNTTYVALLRGALTGAGRAILFDIHTGIGAFGERVAFCMTPPDDSRVAVAETLFGERVRTPARGPEGGRARRGLMLPFLDELNFAPWLLPIGVEFGTYTLPETTVATRAENWAHLNGKRATPEGRRIIARMREAFCPTDADWEQAVIVKSSEMFGGVIGGVGRLGEK